jgi:Inward rectifier potassium channel C-terminal domain
MCSLQARTSYLPSEIMWSHRLFQVIAERHNENDELSVSYRHLNDVIPIEMPHYSAKEYKERYSNGAHDVTITDVVRRASDHRQLQPAHPDLGTGKREIFDRIIIKL